MLLSSEEDGTGKGKSRDRTTRTQKRSGFGTFLDSHTAPRPHNITAHFSIPSRNPFGGTLHHAKRKAL